MLQVNKFEQARLQQYSIQSLFSARWPCLALPRLWCTVGVLLQQWVAKVAFVDTGTPETLGQGGVKLAGVSLPVSSNTTTVAGAQKGTEGGSSTTHHSVHVTPIRACYRPDTIAKWGLLINQFAHSHLQ